MKKLLSICLAMQAFMQPALLSLVPPGMALTKSWQSYYDAGKDYIEAGDYKLGVQMLEASLEALNKDAKGPVGAFALDQRLMTLKQLREVRSTEGDWAASAEIAGQIWKIEKSRPSRSEEAYYKAMSAYCTALLIHHGKVTNGAEDLAACLKELLTCPSKWSEKLAPQILLAKIFIADADTEPEKLRALKEQFKTVLTKIDSNYDCENVLFAVLSFLSHDELAPLAGQKLSNLLEKRYGPESPRLGSALFFMQRSLKTTLPQREEALRRSLKILRKYKLTSQDLHALVSTLLGSCILEQGNTSEAREFLEESKTLADSDKTVSKETAVVVYNNYANLLNQQTNFATAVTYYRKALSCGNNQDILTVRTLINLCQALFATGNLEEAYTVCDQAAKLIVKLKMPRSRDGATALTYLGIIDVQRGQLKQAEIELPLALKIFKQTVPADSPLNLEVLGGLTNLYQCKGDFKEALKYCQESVDLSRKSFGPTSSIYAIYEASRGLLLCQTNQLDEGLSVLEKCREILAEVEPRSLRTCVVLHNLAYALTQKGDNARARAVLKELNEQLVALHAEDQFVAVNGAIMLADLEAKEGHLAEAEKLYRQACKASIAGKFTLIELRSKGGLADVLSLQKKYDEAEKLIGEILATLPPDSAQYVDTLQSLSTVQMRARKFATAIDTQKKAVALAEKIFAPDDERLGSAYAALGKINFAWSKLQDAEPLLRKGLNILVAKQGDSGDDIGQTYLELANVLAAQSKFAEAQTYFTRAMSIYEKLGENGNWRLVDILESQSQAYTDANFYSEAIACLLKAVQIRKQIQSPQNLIDLDEELVAANLVLQGKTREAVAALETIRQRLKTSPNSERTKSVLVRLQPLYKMLGRHAETKQIAGELSAISAAGGAGDTEPVKSGGPVGTPADAEMTLRAKLAAIQSERPDDHLAQCETYNQLALYIREKEKRPKEAAPFFDQALAEAEKHFGAQNVGVVLYLNNAARCYMDLKEYQRAGDYAKRALSIVESKEGKNSAQLAAILIISANCEYESGRELSALQLCERALSIQELRLGKNAVALTETLSYLQFLNMRLKNFDKAKEYADRALSIALTSYGADSPELLIIRRQVAMSAYRAEDYAAALSIFLDNLKTLEKSPNLYDDNLIVITSYDIGSAYRKLAQPSVAVPYLLKALTVIKASENPSAINISRDEVQSALDLIALQTTKGGNGNKLFDAAEECLVRNKLTEALSLCKQGLTNEKSLSKEELGRGQYMLCRIYKTQGKLDEAESALKSGLLNAEADSQLRASMLLTYGDIHTERGNLTEGCAYLEKARNIFDRLEEKPTVQVVAFHRLCLRCLSDIYLEQNKLEPAAGCIAALKSLHGKIADYGLGDDAADIVRESRLLVLQKKSAQAVKLLEDALAVAKDEANLDQVVLRSSLGITLDSLSRVDEAIAVLEPLVSIQPNSPECAANLRDALATLGICYARRNKSEEAIGLFERALTFTEDKNTSVRLVIMCKLADCYSALARLDDYIAILQSIITLEKQIGKIDPETLEAQLAKLASLLDLKKDRAAALLVNKELLALKEKRLGLNSIELVGILNSLGVDTDDLTQHDAAAQYYERAIDIFGKSKQSSSTDMLNVFSNYATLLIRQNKYAEAKICLERALTLVNDVAGTAVNDHRLMIIYDRYALCLAQAGNNSEAAEYFRKSTSLCQKQKDYLPSDAEIYLNAIIFFRSQSDFVTAEKLITQRINLTERQYGKDGEPTFLAVLDKMVHLRDAGKAEQSEQVSKVLLAQVDNLNFAIESKALFYSNYALLLDDLRRYGEEESAYLQCRSLIKQGKLSDEYGSKVSLQLADLYKRQGKFADAKAILSENLKDDEVHGNKVNIVLDLLALSDISRLQGQMDGAQELAMRALTIQTELYPKQELRLGSVRLALGQIFLDQGDYERAAAELEQAAIDLADGGGPKQNTLLAFALLTFADTELGNAARAEKLLQSLLERAQMPPGALLRDEKALVFRALAYTQLRQKKWAAFESTLGEKLAADEAVSAAVPPVLETVSPVVQAALESSYIKSQQDLLRFRNIGIALRGLHARDTRLAPLYIALLKDDKCELDATGRAVLMAQAKSLAAQNPLLLSQVRQLESAGNSGKDMDSLLSTGIDETIKIYGGQDPEVALAIQLGAQTLEKSGGSNQDSIAKEWSRALAIWRSLGEQFANGDKIAAGRQRQWIDRHGKTYELSVADGLVEGAGFFQRSGDRARAQEAVNLALVVLDASADRSPERAAQLFACGKLFKDFCDYARARKSLSLALGTTSDALEFARCQMSLAEVAQNEGDLPEAIACSRKAMDRLKESKKENTPEFADILVEYSDFLRGSGDNAGAIAATTQAISLYEKLQGEKSVRLCEPLLDLTELYKDAGKTEQAKSCLNRALAIASGLGDSDMQLQADIKECAGRLASIEKDYAGARQYFQAARICRDEKSISSSTPDAVHNINEICLLPDTSASERADLLLASCALTDSYVSRVFPQLSLQEQAVFLASTLRPQMDLLLSTNAQTNLLDKTYRYLVRWKGLLVYSLRRQTVMLASASQNISPESIAITDHAARIDTAGFKRLLAANECFVDLYQYQDKSTGEQKQAAIVVNADGAEPPKMLALGAAVANNDLVASWLQSVTGMAITRSGVAKKAHVRLKKRDVESEESDIAPDETAESERRDKLSTKLSQPLLSQLPKGIDRIIVAPDGQLSLIPWSVFLPTVTVSQVNSPREFITLKRTGLSEAAVSKEVLLVGDVDFNQPGITALPSTRLEVSEIGKTATTFGYEPKSLLKDAATKTNVMKAMPQAGFVHLATHGYFASATTPQGKPTLLRASKSILPLSRSPQLPAVLKSERNLLLNSGLLLSRVSGSAAADNTGVLTSEELLKLDLSGCELVSLSACETARGESFSGQGVLGLGSCLMAANPRAVLLSLWKVPDAATEMLMSEFYTQLWQNKLSKAAALKAAQEKVRNDRRYSAPVNWAAWVLIGDL